MRDQDSLHISKRILGNDCETNRSGAEPAVAFASADVLGSAVKSEVKDGKPPLKGTACFPKSGTGNAGSPSVLGAGRPKVDAVVAGVDGRPNETTGAGMAGAPAPPPTPGMLQDTGGGMDVPTGAELAGTGNEKDEPNVGSAAPPAAEPMPPKVSPVVPGNGGKEAMPSFPPKDGKAGKLLPTPGPDAAPEDDFRAFRTRRVAISSGSACENPVV